MERRKYSQESKQDAVQLSYDSEESVTQVAKNLGIRSELLYRWRAEVQQSAGEAFPGKGKRKPADAEMARYRRELEQVRQERDILKKALSVFARPER